MMQNPLVFVACFIVPPLFSLIRCLRYGPNRGTAYAVLPALIGIAILFYVQVSGGPLVNGIETPSRAAVGRSYMLDEAYKWVATFLAGAAIGSVIWKRRQTR